jgi:hypothetical protein
MDRLADAVRRELARFGPQVDLSALTERWPGAVGAAIARNAWPARIGRDGTLHVNTADSVWAFELKQRAAEIAPRLGVVAVRFAPGPLPSADPPPSRPAPPRPSARDRSLAAEIAAPITSTKLRETVGKTVSLSLARGASGRPV